MNLFLTQKGILKLIQKKISRNYIWMQDIFYLHSAKLTNEILLHIVEQVHDCPLR